MDLALSDVVAALEKRYPPSTAEDWDAVGLVVGDPDARIRTVLFAIDPVEAVVEEALERGVDLLVTHHPLYLRGVTSVAATDAKGRVVHRLIRAGIALYVAHTNADIAAGGVNEALAAALGLTGARPLVPAPAPGLDLLVSYAPLDVAEDLRRALAGAGAGAIGDYEGCAWSVTGTGEFTPRPGASPAVGQVGAHERLDETRLEMVVPTGARERVLAALRAAHPYEEPAFSFLPTRTPSGPTGSGRVGDLAEATTLADFAQTVARALPATAHGVRVAGAPGSVVRRVAVSGGSGDAYLGAAAAAGADVYVTADLRHHRAGEALAEPGAPALLDVAHWASEWPWLPGAAADLTADTGLATHVSTRVTDPWTDQVAQVADTHGH
ncbi:Nif3-like dinuclear metal center hexameric protein [Occultella glacieicola]|uniref:GTP cyclohydrolase 1 type 2 homolog n=1 Tax=Occultella glacieicola TaxID=2518684 RepID=A0ABY2E0K5_9MICO|nr:Nif3-like dinuclear metal center hexameric protein [Occultella glacieicola]TDE90044.1 Nif3-like dinuclear metal center hexameric protein [Occultella glacieicola]